MIQLKEKFKEKFFQSLHFTLKNKAIWLRGLLCFFLSISTLYLDNNNFYEARFRLRGKQEVHKDLLLIEIPIEEWTQATQSPPPPVSLAIPDSYFWNQGLWEDVLSKILSANPSSLAISFYFGQNIEFKESPQSNVFFHHKIIWAAQLNNEGYPLKPKFGNNNNMGLINFYKDSEDLVKSFVNESQSIPHIAVKLTQAQFPKKTKKIINLRGPRGTVPSITLSELLNDKNALKKITKKKVIVSAKNTNEHSYLTAAGHLTRAELIANVTDNILAQRWIKKVDNKISIFFLFFLGVFCIWIISSYPQSYALLFFFCIGLSTTGFSISLFDTLNYWTPIIAPITLLISVYIIFLSYHLTIKDSLNWSLEQQRKYQLENEKLKNNFLSLISHDLKTPIAKMQAICDRLLSESIDEKTSRDLKALRTESAELLKYIQSILQITKVESREFKLNKVATDTNKLVRKVIDQVDELAKIKGIHIEHELEPMFLVEIDEVLIKEVILNIIENAIKYTPHEGKIRITSAEVKNRVVVKVTDNGIGIKEINQGLIFQKFYRTPDSLGDHKGSGLGLYLVKYFIELHGGEVFLESKYQDGTTVGFSLPIS